MKKNETSEAKFANTVLYLLERCAPEKPGIQALLKMLWFADLWHYREHLKVITGSEYIAMTSGPVVENYKAVFASLASQGVLRYQQVEVYGKPKKKEEYTPLVEANDDIFDESELRTLGRVVKECAGESGTALSRRTHLDGPWLHVWNEQRPNQPIHRTAFRWLDNLPDDDDCILAQTCVARMDVQSEIGVMSDSPEDKLQ